MNKQVIINNLKAAAKKTAENALYAGSIGLASGLMAQFEMTGEWVWVNGEMHPVYKASGISLKDTGKVILVMSGVSFIALECYSGAKALYDIATGKMIKEVK